MTKTRKKDDYKYLFYILYSIEFAFAFVFSAISSLGFLWSKVLSALFIFALYVTVYVHELIAHHKLSDIICYSLIFLGCAPFLLLLFYSKELFTFIAVLYSAAMMCLIFFRYILYMRATNDLSSLTSGNPDSKPALATMFLLICAMIRMLNVNFVSEIFMAWSFIPAAIICAVISGVAFALLRKSLKDWIITTARKVLTCITIAVTILLISFFYCYTTVGVANCVFDYNEPTPIECTVLDMHIRSGTRTPTQYEVKAIINGETEWIDVTSSEYDKINKGDIITVNYYPGALGIAYYLYEE